MKRTKLCGVLTLLMMAALLTSGTSAFCSTDKITLRPQGYSLTDSAYVVPVKDGRDTLALIAQQDAELAALHGYIASQDMTVAGISHDISELRAQLTVEREAWTAKLDKLSSEVRRLRSPWAIGLFGGWDVVHSQPVVGVGLTYRLVGLGN